MPHITGKTILLMVFPFLLCFLAGCENTDTSVSRSGIYFDTAITITLYETENGTSEDGKELLDECFSLCEKYEALLSCTAEGSDIYRINHAGGEPVEVSDETAALIEKALSYSELTGGVFDCTIAPLSDLWDFGNDAASKPDDRDICEALSHVGYQNVLLDGSAVTLTDRCAAIDLGGIAKGYIADQLKSFLQASGVASALIDLGGNILALGSKPDGSAFRIGVRRPFGDGTATSAVVSVCDSSLVTSGVYERYFEENGVLYHHLLNPFDGYPFDNGLYSVSILCDSSADADALSTSCFGLGLEKGLELIESIDGAEALFITDDYELYRSSGFPE